LHEADDGTLTDGGAVGREVDAILQTILGAERAHPLAIEEPVAPQIPHGR